MTGWLLGAAGIVLCAAGNVPAIRAAWRRSFSPQVLSWTGWAGIMLIGGWGSWRGSWASGGYVVMCAAGCLAVAALAARSPAPGSARQPAVRVRLPGGRRARLDLVCAPGTVAGLVLLLLVRDPGWAVGISVVTDAVLYVPTFADGWRAPQGQPLAAYALFAGGAAASCAAVLYAHGHRPAAVVAVPLFAALAYPVYLLAADGAMAGLVAGRRRLSAEGRVPAGGVAVEAGAERYDVADARRAAAPTGRRRCRTRRGPRPRVPATARRSGTVGNAGGP